MNKVSIKNVELFYDDIHVLKHINMDIQSNKITAVIGMGGSGKTSLLRIINRMSEFIPKARVEGDILLDGESIYQDLEVKELRTRVGMVSQNPNLFPKSIYENVAFGPRTRGIRNKQDLDGIVEKSLQSVNLWDELKDRLRENAFMLSDGDQQRLCIARALSVNPEVLLMDEPTTALDPISAAKIEEVAIELKQKHTIILATHNLLQAVRISNNTAFLMEGELVEYNKTETLFSIPSDKRTEDYITGRFE